jgi:hypothetical protein
MVITSGSPNLSQCVSTAKGLQTGVQYVFGFRFKGIPGGSDAYCSVSFYSDLGCTESSVGQPNDGTGFAASNGTNWATGVISFETTSDAKSVLLFCSGANGSGYYDRMYLSLAEDPGF